MAFGVTYHDSIAVSDTFSAADRFLGYTVVESRIRYDMLP